MNTRYPMNTYKSWLQAINPQEWLAATRDESGKEVWFTAAQFWRYLPEAENYGVLRATYFINQEKEGICTISFYREIAHPALCCRWYHISTLGDTAIDISEPGDTATYAARVAQIIEAASLDTTNDYQTMDTYTKRHMCSHHEYLRRKEDWSPECIFSFWEQFVPAYRDEYRDAAVRRMKCLATNRPDAITNFIVTPNLGNM